MMEPLPHGFEEAIEAAQNPRRLRRVLNLLRWGLPPMGRYRRYVVSIAPALGAVWGLTALYLVAAPVKYESAFTMILPGSGAGSSMNLESIGQAQNTSSSAFSSPTLSPTEGYKQLLSADVTLREAARMAHLPEAKFPAPKVKLIVQTNLIEVAITGKTPQQARANGEALIAAFQAELDHLRGDEAARREEQDRKHLAELAAKERAAEARLIDFQARHGLATLEQFNSRIAAVDGLKDKERDLRIALRQHQGESGRLAQNLKSNPQLANLAWRLRGDPVFQELVQRYAVSNANAEEKAGTLGPRHSAMAQNNAERAELLAAVMRRGHAITAISDGDVMRVVDLTLADGRSALLQTMDMGDAQAAGTARALGELRGDIANAQAQKPDLIANAQQLADLQRDQRIAAAVFSSALARLDTNKLDPFASYPLVQTLATPTLPGKKSSPSAIIALAGALGASLLILIGFVLTWLRQPILNRMMRKG